MKQPSVLLGMSGGTDSSVSAMLLLEQGYEVTGVTFRFYSSPASQTALADAQQLAARLGIDHHVIDVEALFEEQIIGYFVDEYMSGRTPVPCVKCNNRLKWPLLIKEADKLGIQYVATGHYVRKLIHNNTVYITKGADPDKDQSFFLWGLDQPTLSRAIFPLGGMIKSDVRAYAAQRGFTKVATTKDSLGVCFCPGDYQTFLRRRVGSDAIHPGSFVDEAGNHIGQHFGYPLYTVGQRRGLGVQRRFPLFVKEICAKDNAITLAPISSMYKTSFVIKESNWTDFTIFTESLPLICRIRYRKQATPCRLVPIGAGRVEVHLLEPLESIAPGQSAVFYHNDRVMGGGIIV